MRISLSGLQLTVSQHLGNLVYTAPRIDHIGRHGVPQVMHPHIWQPCGDPGIVPGTMQLYVRFQCVGIRNQVGTALEPGQLLNDLQGGLAEWYMTALA